MFENVLFLPCYIRSVIIHQNSAFVILLSWNLTLLLSKI